MNRWIRAGSLMPAAGLDPAAHVHCVGTMAAIAPATDSGVSPPGQDHPDPRPGPAGPPAPVPKVMPPPRHLTHLAPSAPPLQHPPPWPASASPAEVCPAPEPRHPPRGQPGRPDIRGRLAAKGAVQLDPPEARPACAVSMHPVTGSPAVNTPITGDAAGRGDDRAGLVDRPPAAVRPRTPRRGTGRRPPTATRASAGTRKPADLDLNGHGGDRPRTAGSGRRVRALR